MLTTGFLFVAATLLQFSVQLVDAGCYDPNGVDTNERRNTTDYIQCDSSQSHKMCCRSGVDTCRFDGLCSNKGQLWRESCSDKTWSDPSCLKLCISGTAQINSDSQLVDMSTVDVRIKMCGDGSLCCGANDSEAATSCCTRGEGVRIVNNQVVPNSISNSGSVSSTLPATSTTSGAPASGASTRGSSTPGTSTGSLASASASSTGTPAPTANNTPTIIGASIGGTAALLLSCGALIFCLYRRRQSNRAHGEQVFSPNGSVHERSLDGKVVYAYRNELADTPIAEMNDSQYRGPPRELADTPVSEIAGLHLSAGPRVELPDNQVGKKFVV